MLLSVIILEALIMPKIESSFVTHLIKYSAVGVINTLVGYSLIFGLMFLRVDPFVANFVVYFPAIFLSYFLNRGFTFKCSKSHKQSFPRFIGVLLVAYVANLCTLTLLIRFINLDQYLSQVIAGIVYVLIGFTGSKFFAFSGVRGDYEQNIEA